MLVVGDLLKDLPPEDRVSPIVGMIQGVVERAGELRVEVPDTNEGKELLKFCRKLTVPLRQALRDAGVMLNRRATSALLFTCFLSPAAAVTLATLTVTTTPLSLWVFLG